MLLGSFIYRKLDVQTAEKLSFRILMDNIGNDDLLIEHGFSVWIEYGDKVTIFDTGQSDAFIKNAQKLGCDLSKVDTLVLSHGHYDHTGGIAALYSINPDITLIAHPAVMTYPRYSLHPGKPPRMIAMPASEQQVIETLPESQSIGTKNPYEIYPGFYFSGEIPRIHEFEDVGGPFYLDTDKRKPDTLPDDASLWFQTENGLIILTGCCHSGLINTVEHIQKVSGEDRIAGIIGGLHLLHANEERINITADALNQWQPQFVIACHCTGSDAIQQLKQKTSVNIVSGYCGFVMNTE